MGAGRPRDPQTAYRMRRRTIGGYSYAATQAYMIDEQTGKEKRQIRLWGKLTEDNKFIPSQEYLLLPPAERKKLIFPAEWDLSELAKLPSERGPGRPVTEGEARDRIYGAVWFMEQLAEQLDVTKDLLTVFDGNQEKTRDVLSLAIYLYVTAEPFSHMADWQDIEWYPAVHRLTPKTITHLVQTITEADRAAFIKLRGARLGKEAVCAVDSTTRGSCGTGTHLPDVALGKNKDNIYEQQTTEVVVYGLETHEPVYYKTVPGNVPDSKTVPTILKDLHTAGYHNLVLVTDRGYECARTLELCILRRQKLLTAANVGQARILEKIRELGDIGSEPPGMEWLPGEEIFCRQYDLNIELKGRRGKPVQADKLRLNLYFDPVRRAQEQAALLNTIATQKKNLLECQANSTPVWDEDCRHFGYFRLKRNKESCLIESFELDSKKVQKAKETLGFFAIYTLGVAYTAPEALQIYGLRDEQEKFFYSMKTRIDCDLQRNWSEKARRGARFIEFVALILICRIVQQWRTSEQLSKAFKYVYAQILAMRRIHLHEQPGKEKFIPLFLEKQALICREYGIHVPTGCEPEYNSVEVKPKRKRGRPRKTDDIK